MLDRSPGTFESKPARSRTGRAGGMDAIDLAAALAELTGLMMGSGADPDHRWVGTVIGDAETEFFTGAE